MQIELIATASEDSAFLPRLGLGVLASLTPPEDQVIYTDDLVRPFDLERDVDVAEETGTMRWSPRLRVASIWSKRNVRSSICCERWAKILRLRDWH